MNGWALSLSGSGAVRSIDPGHACTQPPEGQFTWVHLDGKEAETTRWLQQHGHLPETVVAALTAVETRPRSEKFAEGALVNLRGLHPAGEPLQGERVAEREVGGGGGVQVDAPRRALPAERAAAG